MREQTGEDRFIIGQRIQLIAILILSLTGSAWSADDSPPWTVLRLNESKPWESLAGSARIRVEGRIAASSGTQFRLQKCDAVFAFEKEKPPSIAPKSFVEVKGHFKKEGTKLIFSVESLKTAPSYQQQFDQKMSRLQRSKAEEWIELGDWVNELAKFYEDPELTRRANEAYTKAIEADYRQLKPTNFEGRFELAARMAKYNLSARRQRELEHEGLRIQWAQLKRATPPDLAAWKQFAALLPERLTGANEPLKMKLPHQRDEYLRDPEGQYRKTSDEVRPNLNRLFFIEVTRAILLQEESSDGHDGDTLAAQAEAFIPEETEFAEAFRLKRLEFGRKNIATATRSEAERLAEAFRKRQQNENARELLVDWIKAHDARLRSEGLVGLTQLADEYLTLLNDRPAAVQCLLEAYKIDPMFEAVKTKLTALGYVLRDGIWNKSGASTSSTTESQTPSSIEIGMTASNLRSLMGQPRTITRAITARAVTEVWSFGATGSTSLIVRLEQERGDRELKVALISGE